MPEIPLRSRQYLTLKVDGETVALPANEVVEVIRPRAMTRVPNGPPSLLGLSNLRNAVLPVVSLAQLIGRAKRAPTSLSRVVVIRRDSLVGFFVDEVASLSDVAQGHALDPDTLLARDFGSLIRRQASANFSGSVETPAAVGTALDEMALICFALGKQEYALPLSEVHEVAVLPANIAELPKSDDAMLGVAELRNSLVPIVSLSALLGLPHLPADTKRSRIVVTPLGGRLVGLLSDGIKEILRVPKSALDPVPTVLTRGRGEARLEAICRLEGGRLVSVLASSKLFDAETTARILASAASGADEMDDTKAQGRDEQFIVFQLGDEHYGLPVESVDEVVRRPDNLTRVPRAPAFVEGVMNLRGKMVPVIDQRQRFAVAGGGDSRTRRVVIVTIDGLQTGFVVDKVSEVLAISTEELRPAPEFSTDAAAVFDRIATVERDGRMILIVNPKAILDLAERDLMKAFNAGGEPALTK
jgi:purine-binding chemotaxis protein CheW